MHHIEGLLWKIQDVDEQFLLNNDTSISLSFEYFHEAGKHQLSDLTMWKNSMHPSHICHVITDRGPLTRVN